MFVQQVMNLNMFFCVCLYFFISFVADHFWLLKYEDMINLEMKAFPLPNCITALFMGIIP